MYANGAGPSFLLILLLVDGCIVGLSLVMFAAGAPQSALHVLNLQLMTIVTTSHVQFDDFVLHFMQGFVFMYCLYLCSLHELLISLQTKCQQ